MLNLNIIGNLLGIGGGGSFNPVPIQSKFAAWYKGEESTYIIDQIGAQDREALIQNSLSGQVFPGRARKFEGTTRTGIVADNGSLDIGTAPFSMSFWIKFDAVTLFSRFMGKYVNGTTSGEYWFSTGGSAASFNIRTSSGTTTLGNIITSIVADTWYHIVITISADGKIYGYLNKTLAVSNPSWTGTFGTIANTTGLGVNTTTSLVSSPSGYGQISLRDLRIFKGKELTSAERTSCFDGKYVTGFTDWWDFAGNSSIRSHSAKNGGNHLIHTNATSPFITGYWRSIYNEYGYAENATYGQIPADLTTLVNNAPTVDCLGNALVFYGSSKRHLQKSGSDFVMPVNTTVVSDQIDKLEQSTEVIGLNTWYSFGTPQAVAVASTAIYCGARQFYNSTIKELIILKDYEDYTDDAGITRTRSVNLTVAQEAALMSYIGNPSRVHSYHANSSSFFARFTNSYSDLEKSCIDNVVRVMVNTGIWDTRETCMIPVPGFEEQKLDLISSAYNVSPNNVGAGSVSYQIGKGLAAQVGSYKNGFNFSTATKFLQNDASFTLKLSDNEPIPFGSNNGGIIFGAYDAGVSNVFARFDFNTSGKNFYFGINSNSVGGLPTPNIDTNSTFLVNRTASNAVNVIARRAVQGTATTVSAARPNTENYLGNAHVVGGFQPGASTMNYVQHLSFGSSLTFTNSIIMGALMDTYCDGVHLRNAVANITATGFTYKLEDKCFIDRLGDQVIWSDYFNLYYSTDGGTTIAARLSFNNSTLGWPHFAHIFDNGKIIFGTSKNKWYKTTTTLSSATEIVPTKNGVTYTIHTPTSATYPGEYTKFLGVKQKQYLGDGTEIFVYNNYGLSIRGACPVIVIYSFGEEIKIAYEHGTNPYYRDNGSPNGSTTGNFVGDAANTSSWVRHGHGVQQRPDDKTKFISMWGDLDQNVLSPAASAFKECKFMEHIYNQGNDTWTTNLLIEDGQSTRIKATSAMMPGDGYIYTTSDAGITGSNQVELGYFKKLLSASWITANFVRFYTPLSLTKPSNMFHLDSDGRFVGGGYAATGGTSTGGFFNTPNLIWSSDMVNFNEVTLSIPGNVYVFKITKIRTKVYQFDIMGDYDYYLGARSLIITFN